MQGLHLPRARAQAAGAPVFYLLSEYKKPTSGLVVFWHAAQRVLGLVFRCLFSALAGMVVFWHAARQVLGLVFRWPFLGLAGLVVFRNAHFSPHGPQYQTGPENGYCSPACISRF